MSDARPTWRVATVAETTAVTPRARRIVLDVPGWPGSAAGQHLDVRLTAPDGYQASRSYSLASVGDAERIELLVERVDDGEVSGYLTDELRAGDELEVLGPLGRWFIWRPSAALRPVLLLAGGAGVVPIVSILRARAAAASAAPMRMLYSVRSPAEVLFSSDLEAARAHGVDVAFAYTRSAPEGSPVGRISRARLAGFAGDAAEHPLIYVCGTTGFVEQLLTWLVEFGHREDDIRPERFGGT